MWVGLGNAFIDLDVDGMNYDELLLLGELIGPAKSAGLSQRQVASLPTHPFLPRSLGFRAGVTEGGGVEEEVEEEEERSLMCVVCLCTVEEGEVVKVLPRCGHEFHSEGCVDLWLKLHNSCPICKAAVIVGGREGGSDEEV